MAVGFKVCVPLSFLLLLSLATNCNAQNWYCSRTYNASSGTIMSPNYPSNYDSYSNCLYTVTAPASSSIVFTVRLLSLESADRCTFDWIEVSCNDTFSSSVPVRYCGYASNLSSLVLQPCRRAVVQFRSDGSVTYSGFLIDFSVTPGCGDNCTLNSTGCPVGCTMTYGSLYQDQKCVCRMPLRLTVTTAASTSCPSGCFYEYDFYGRRTCRCQQVTTEAQCPYWCTRRTDWYGYVTCDCNVTTNYDTTSSCPYGCYNDRDYWGYRFCNCRASTQPPIWCSPGCTSAYNAYGQRYCQCQTTAVNWCRPPCYLRYDRYQSDYCYCPPTTASMSVCGRTSFDSYGIIASPNYPSRYSSSSGDCYQYISTNGATSVKIEILDVDLYYTSSYYCSYDYIQITGCDGSVTTVCSPSSLTSSTLEFFCSRWSQQTTVRFHPHLTYYNRAYRGFKMAYSARYSSNCSYSGVYLTEGSSGVINSPNYPYSFTDNSQCTNYLYTDQWGIIIQIRFNQLQLESYSTCREVFLVLSCEDREWPINRTVCGYTVPPPMTFNCRTLKIYFRANRLSYRLSSRSFSLRYYATKVIDQTTYSYAATKQPGALNTYTLGLALGLGGGGLLLVILVILVIVITVSYRRQMARMEQRHLQELTVLCRNMRPNGGNGETGADVTFSRGNGSNNGAPNGLSYDLLAFEPPSYQSPGLNGGGGGGGGGAGAGAGGVASGAGGGGEDPEHPQSHFDSDEALLLP